MKNLRGVLLIALSLIITNTIVLGQGAETMVDPDNFNSDLLISLLKEKIHAKRLESNADTFLYHEVLMKAAQDQSDWMNANKKESIDQIENPKKITTSHRIQFYGGTSSERVAENVKAVKYARGKSMFTYGKVVNELFSKWDKKKDTLQSMKHSAFIYSGIGVSVDKDQKKIFLSHVMAELGALNMGVQYRKSLAAPYGKKKYGLVAEDELLCEEVRSFKYYNQLQSGLEKREGKVYLKYNDVNHIMDLLTESKDGFAIDFVQKDQYACNTDNIYDNTLLSKGILSKPTYQSKIFKKNIATDETLEVVVGKFPKKIQGDDYEMNLLVIKGKSVCKTIKRSFLEIKDVASNAKVEILPDTIEILPDTLVTSTQDRYKVGYEDKSLNFIIPFEYSKYNYNKNDIKPFLEALDEPHFVIHKVTFYAHSSLEGDSIVNAKLREKRAKSIVKAMEDFQSKDIDATIIYDDSWNMFKKQIKGTEFSNLGSKSKKEVKRVLATNKKIRNGLEPILDEERFARIAMFVTVDDIQGMAEEKYLKKKVTRAIEDDDYEKALKTQRFIIEGVMEGKYPYQAILDQEFPYEPQFASLVLNQIWAMNHFEESGSFTDALAAKFDSLYALAPENPYARYNKLLCSIKRAEWTTINDMDSLQVEIDALYNTVIPGRMINQLNIEFQFSILDWYEKSSKLNKIALAKAINKIRKAFDPGEASWSLALKVATLYGKHKYFKQALEALDPLIGNIENMNDSTGKVNEELLFTYVIISSQMNDGDYNKSFRDALNNAARLNKARYCNLFGAPYLSFQLLDDPLIKSVYCKECQGDVVKENAEEKGKSGKDEKSAKEGKAKKEDKSVKSDKEAKSKKGK